MSQMQSGPGPPGVPEKMGRQIHGQLITTVPWRVRDRCTRGGGGVAHKETPGGCPQGRALRLLLFLADGGGGGELTSLSHLVICAGGEGSPRAKC